MNLDAKVKAFIGDKYLGEYTVAIEGDCLTIYPTPDTAGRWTWYIRTLFGFDKFAAQRPTDRLLLDGGQNWFVTGMFEVYREVIAKLTHPEPIAVVLEGGLVQGAISDSGSGPDVIIIDYDIEGAEEEDLIQIDQGNGTTVDALACIVPTEKAGISVKRVLMELAAR